VGKSVVGTSSRISFTVLGSLRVSVEGKDHGLPPGQLRWLLAVLLLSDGRLVSDEHLIRHAWGPQPITRAALRTAASRLRTWLGAVDSTLHHTGDGYRLQVPPGSVDAHRFTAAWRTSAELDDSTRFTLLDEALGTWDAQPLADAPEWVLADPAVAVLQATRLDCLRYFGDLSVRLGKPDAALAYLAHLCAHHAADEPLHAVYLRVLTAAGRPAQALLHYEQLRIWLRDELGVAPSEEVQAAYRAVLALETDNPPSQAAPVPAQLPLDILGFAARQTELDRLNAILAHAGTQPTATTVCAIFGTAGVGKTTLAVHWAHGVRDRFPDGQLYINLHGYSTNPRVRPIAALATFLRALGVPNDRVPENADEAAALYRSCLAGRRVLVVLDDAADAEQVRPLLPATAGCLAVVTSRDALTGLIARDGAHRVDVNVLAAHETRALLARLLGDDRVAAEPDAADELARLCGHLPLALRIAVANFSDLESLSAYAARLAASNRLAALEVDGDEPTAVRAALDLSYAALPAPAQRLFRRLGLLDTDVTATVAAALDDVPVAEAERRLGRLHRAHLLTQSSLGRYHWHDLLRLYAAERVAGDSEADRRAAWDRLRDHYLHSAYNAARLMNPHRPPIPLPPAEPGSRPAVFADRDAALVWFTAHHAALLSALRQAAACHDRHTWRLAWCLATFFEWQGHWHDLELTQQLAIDTARSLGDRAGQTTAHRILATAYGRTGRYGEALAHYGKALDLTDPNDHAGLASVHQGMAWILGLQDDHARALDASLLALSQYQIAGDDSGQARTLNAVGWHSAQLGDYAAALVYCERALALNRRLGDPYGQAETLDSLGYAYRQLGDLTQAIEAYEGAVALFGEAGERFLEADSMTHLGEAQRLAGNVAQARRTWCRAASMLDELGHHCAGEVRQALDDLDRDAAGKR
jgi:DNA-binding SARP family transcriptional activator/tetratricopeptide (TPR) repeat protein